MCQKLVIVVLGLVSLVSAAPGLGYLGSGYPHGLPPATSYSSRIDYHGPEYVKTYAAPVLTKAVIPTHIVKSVIPSHIVKPVVPSVSYYDKPLVGYGGYSHGLGNGLGYEYGLGQGLEHAVGYGYGQGLGVGYGQGLKHHYY